MPAYKITTPDGKSYKVTAESPDKAYAALASMPKPQSPEMAAGTDELSQMSSDPTTMAENANAANPVSKFESAVRGIGQGLTFGFGDEIAGGLKRLGLQKEGTEELRRGNAIAQQSNPVTYGAGELGGAVGGAIATPALAPLKAGMLGGRIGAGTAATGNAILEGGALSGAYGAGTAEGGVGDRIMPALTSAGVGAATGGALGLGASALARRGAAKAAEAAIPDTAGIKAASQAGFDAAHEAGLVVTPKGYGTLADDIGSMLRDNGFHPGIQKNTRSVAETIMKGVNEKAPATLQDMQNLRTLASNAVQDSIMKPSDRRLAVKLRDKIDDFMDNLDKNPHFVESGNPEVAVPALKQARADWAKFRRSETIDETVKAAQTRASQFSGTGLNNAMVTEFRQLSRNPKRMAAFSPAEQEMIKGIARGTPVNRLLRQVGKLAPTNVISQAAGLYSGILNPTTLGAWGGGLAAKGLATRGTRKAVERASRLVRSRGVQELEPDPETIRTLLQIAVMAGKQGGAVSGVAKSNLLPAPMPEYSPPTRTSP